MSDEQHDTKPRVITVSLPDRIPLNEPCSYLMTTGSRKNRAKRQGGYTVHGKAKRYPCPARATRKIDGKPYCDQHGPSKYQIDPFYDSIHWRNLRKAVLMRDDNRCRYCEGAATQADHVIPRAKGGADAMENLVACCPTCNKTAAGNLFPSFGAKKRWILANRPTPKKAERRPKALLDQWQKDREKAEKEQAA